MCDIVELRPEKTRKVYECGCSNQFFVLLDNGAVECSACRITANNMRCFQPIEKMG